MKKLLSLLAILLVAVGCTNEEKLLDEPVMRKSVTSVKASFEESAETRTHFLDDTKLVSLTLASTLLPIIVQNTFENYSTAFLCRRELAMPTARMKFGIPLPPSMKKRSS